MRIVLLYPPPWKIPAPGEEPDQSGEGPPKDWEPEKRFGGDEVATPYGLLSLAAQAIRAGHDVTLFNIYLFAWRDITDLIRHLPADLYGLSCFTSNRRGTIAVSRLIRKMYPHAYIVVGGPHASALPREMLEHCKAIDGVVIGEGEETFSELIEHLAHDEFNESISGMVWRSYSGIEAGPPRKRIHNLDSLVSPVDCFESHFIISSRGCPGNCTFCGSAAQWGRIVRFHSVEYTLEMIERIVNTQKNRIIFFKDETFTLNRKRVLQICDGIIKRKINFLWSCDTRVDRLDEEVLLAMRKAGCQRISVGLESASHKILKSINKGTTPELVLSATRMAKKFGLQIRYYVMAGNRGESAETLKTSIDFIVEAKPNEFMFSYLSLYPGTEEFHIAESSGLVRRDMFFSEKLYSFDFTYGEDSPQLREICNWINAHLGIRKFWDYSIAELETISALFPDLPAAHMDLGGTHYQLGNYSEAEKHIRIAIDMGYPLPILGYNYLACIAASCGDFKSAINYFEQAKALSNDSIVDDNLQSLRAWLLAGGLQSGHRPNLIANHDLERPFIAKQPILPGPIVIHSTSTESDMSPIIFMPQPL